MGGTVSGCAGDLVDCSRPISTCSNPYGRLLKPHRSALERLLLLTDCGLWPVQHTATAYRKQSCALPMPELPRRASSGLQSGSRRRRPHVSRSAHHFFGAASLLDLIMGQLGFAASVAPSQSPTGGTRTFRLGSLPLCRARAMTRAL